MKHVFALIFTLVSTVALAEDIEVCGAVESVSHHTFSLGTVKSIKVYQNNGFTTFKDGRDIVSVLQILGQLESSDVSVDLSNIKYSQDKTESYLLYDNYKLKNEYYVCATVDSYLCRKNICGSSRSFSFYRVLDNGERELLYSRAAL